MSHYYYFSYFKARQKKLKKQLDKLDYIYFILSRNQFNQNINQKDYIPLTQYNNEIINLKKKNDNIIELNLNINQFLRLFYFGQLSKCNNKHSISLLPFDFHKAEILSLLQFNKEKLLTNINRLNKFIKNFRNRNAIQFMRNNKYLFKKEYIIKKTKPNLYILYFFPKFSYIDQYNKKLKIANSYLINIKKKCINFYFSDKTSSKDQRYKRFLYQTKKINNFKNKSLFNILYSSNIINY